MHVFLMRSVRKNLSSLDIVVFVKKGVNFWITKQIIPFGDNEFLSY